jgi:hypothetical protein
MLVKSEKSSKPDGFVIYSKTLQSALLLPDDSAGRVLKAAARLFLTGEAPEGLELSEEIVLSLFTGDIDSALTHHAEVCARNQRIAANRRAPSVTSRDESLPVAPNTNPNSSSNTNQNSKDGAASPPTRTRFIPPSVEEIAAYCHERQNGIDARRFFDYYTANGWTQGRGKPIRDWRAAVRTWERGGSHAGQDHSGDGRSAANSDTIDGVLRL